MSGRRDNEESTGQNTEPEGYPLYPPSEDIYAKFKEEQDIDPEDITRTKEPTMPPDNFEEEGLDPVLEELGLLKELDELEILNEDIMGQDLDIPGSELDDDLEEIGNEDEENNYYSIGGDNHHDLEEDDGILDEEF